MVLEEFIKLASIDSDSTQERELARYLQQRLPELGCEVYVDRTEEKTGSNTGNVLARLPGNHPGAPALFFCCHMDTVGSTAGMVPQVREGFVYSNGQTVLGADDKAGIAALLAYLELLREQPERKHGDLEFLFTVQEETGLIGSSHFDTELLRAEQGYILDGDGPVGTLTVQAPSRMMVDLHLTGKAAHSGLEPEKGVNAIVVAASAIAAVPSGRLDEETTSNYSAIRGGTLRNIVAEQVTVEAEVRSQKREKLDAQVDRMVQSFQRQADAFGAKLMVDKKLSYNNFRVEAGHPLVENARRACVALGLEPTLNITGGGLDANIFNGKGIPAIALGIGVENPHSSQERIAVAQLESLVKLVDGIVEVFSH